jgi:UDP-N-acetylmuramate dehydrogenase
LIVDAPLKALNTFGIDARARWLVEVSDVAQIAGALNILRSLPDGADPLVLGGGSNLLITGDVRRPVLRVALRGRRILGESDGRVRVQAAAAEPWDDFVQWTLSQGLSGLENLSLIPGTVGAAPIQNIGAYGVEMAEHFESLDAVDLRDATRRVFTRDACAFGYRDSVFKRPEGRHWLIVAVRFALSRTPRLRLDYGDIRAQLARDGVVQPAPADVARAVSAIRRRRLPDPAVIGNAGSFFKNPLVDAAAGATLRAAHPALPAWPAGSQWKLSAAWMIEQCGWKGRRIGDAGVHADHALVLVNHGAARGADILALAGQIVDSVRARFGVTLEPEPTVA